MVDIRSLLQRCSLFKNKSVLEIDKLISAIDYRIESFQENDIVFSPLQQAVRIGIVISGSVDVQKLIPTGKVTIIDRKKPAEMIAESSIFSKINYYPDTVSVSEQCRIFFIYKADLQKMFSLDKDIMLNFLEHISNCTLMLKHKIGILSLDSIKEKIAGYLIYQHKITGSQVITLPFSKKDWAEYMNVSRTSLSRELRKLTLEGIVSFQKRRIRIEDLKGLEAILSL